ncbi:glutathione S-transferase [soil metagenome]
MAELTLYGVPGWGSVLAEALLTCCGVPFIFEEVEGFDQPGAARDRLLALNPVAQVPTLVLADGLVMTESVAIALWLSETYPAANLAPAPGSQGRPEFLRRLVWLSAAVYSTFTYADYPERWTTSDAKAFQARLFEQRKSLWRGFEGAIPDGGWSLPTGFSAIDIFVSVMTRWRPGRAWFEAECLRLFAIAKKVDALEQLKPVWARNFPEG